MAVLVETYWRYKSILKLNFSDVYGMCNFVKVLLISGFKRLVSTF